MEYILLFNTAVLAGALNAVAGGGSFFTFPALIFTGVNPIVANATNTMAIWPGEIASGCAYYHEIENSRQRFPALIAASLAGSLIGTILLLITPAAIFSGLIPYLLLFSTLLFAFSEQMGHLLRGEKASRLSPVSKFIMQLLIAVYGGYFGGGMGIMMLAMLSFMGLTNIYEMAALKTLLSVVINGISVIIFIAAGMIAWPQAFVMICGAMIGGYWGATYARKVSAAHLRQFVIVTGLAIALYFFIK